MVTIASLKRALTLLALTPSLLTLSRSGETQTTAQTPDKQPAQDKQAAPDKQTSTPPTAALSEQKFQFELNKNPSGLFHVVVKQAGPIAVTVTGALANGDGVSVQVLGPGNMPVLTGDLNTPIAYTVTAADIKRGTGWLVRVLPKRKGGANTKPPAPAPTQRFLFTTGRSRKSNFAFTVAHAGPITVDVKASLRDQSALQLRLRGPNGTPTITGNLDGTINYTVTQEDLSRGRFWNVQILEAPKPAPAAVAKTGAQEAGRPNQPPAVNSGAPSTTKVTATGTSKTNPTAPVKVTSTPPDAAGSQKIQLSVAHNRTGFFSFTVTKLGPVSIEVTGIAKPQPVHISGPKNSPSLTGTTGKPISYIVTAADLKRGEFWTAQVTMPKK